MRLLMIPVIALSVYAKAENLKLDILLNGTEVGSNTWSRSADGSFQSKTAIEVGSVTLTGSISGHMAKGRVTDFVAKTHNPSGNATVSLADGKLTLSAAGKTEVRPFDDKTGDYGGNLHPQLWVSSLLDAERTLETNAAGKQVTETVSLLDIGAAIPIKFTQLSNKSLTVDGALKVVRRFSMELPNVVAELDLDDANEVVGFDVPGQHLRFIAEGWNALFADPLAKYPELSQATYKTVTETGAKMKTRDGVDLVCDIVRPDDDEKHPAILVRTPYGRGTETINGAFYASRGYAFVTQDCRGREASGGQWDPFVHEGDDGYDTVQWVASQPWCDGKVGMIGGSYGGYVQWAAAVEDPPALKCIVPEVSPPDAMRNIPYDHGIFALYLDLWWAKIVAGRRTDFSTLQSALPHPHGLTALPLDRDDQAVLGKKLDFYQAWLRRPVIGDWKGWDFTYHLDRVNIPALHISGTWDGDEIGTHINWTTMRSLGRKNQWIVFGPWTHAFNTTHRVGDVEYGPQAILDLDSLYVRWFDTWLKGKDVGLDKVPHVQLFLTGANKWLDLKDWPASSMSLERLYLNRHLLSKGPSSGAPVSYVYDPSKDTKIPKQLIDVDPSKQSTGLRAKDLAGKPLLLVETQPFSGPVAVASPITLKLYFRTSARDTDFYATPLDVAPDGQLHAVGMPGKIRGSYLGGMDKVRPLVPGKIYEATITPWDFAHEFDKGHRFALLIQSSGFPIYSRNLGTGEPIATATRMVVQKNSLLMDRRHPSSVSFYVVGQ